MWWLSHLLAAGSSGYSEGNGIHLPSTTSELVRWYYARKRQKRGRRKAEEDTRSGWERQWRCEHGYILVDKQGWESAKLGSN